MMIFWWRIFYLTFFHQCIMISWRVLTACICWDYMHRRALFWYYLSRSIIQYLLTLSLIHLSISKFILLWVHLVNMDLILLSNLIAIILLISTKVLLRSILFWWYSQMNLLILLLLIHYIWINLIKLILFHG